MEVYYLIHGRRDGMLAYLKLNSLALGIHAHLQLHVLHKRLQYAVPVLFQRSNPVPGHWNAPILGITLALGQVTQLDFVEFHLVVFLLLDCLKLCQLINVGIVNIHLGL